MKTKIVGILNVSLDSFSDGGQYFAPQNAIIKGKDLKEAGAHIIDIGAESSHPDSAKISVEEEIKRLAPVIQALKKDHLYISVDTYKPEVMEYVLNLGVNMINDITALSNPLSIEILNRYDAPIVLMYARNIDPKANKSVWESDQPTDVILSFFEKRLEHLVREGIKKERLILDPGMGFFLGSNPEPSLKVLKEINRFKQLGQKLYVSTSRKSFIGSILGRTINERGIGTLATEIWAVLQGVDYVRTHDVKPLNDALRMIQAIEEA